VADGKLERDFIRSALALASRPEVDRLVIVTDRPLSPAELRGRPLKKKLVYAVTDEAIADQVWARRYLAVVIPPYEYARIERIKVALVACRSEGLVRDGDTIVALAGRAQDVSLDTLIRVRIGAEQEEERVRVDAIGLAPEFSSQVVEGLIHTAMEIGAQGYEGHAVGTILVVGDATAVMEKSRQILINPFQGVSEVDRNCIDPAIRAFAVLDGAFVVREDGVVLAAGRYLQSVSLDVKAPMGLGARHAAAAAVTAETRAIAVTVSQTSGAVRVFKQGGIVLEIHQMARRI